MWMTVQSMLTGRILVLCTDGYLCFWVSVPRLKNTLLTAETAVKCWVSCQQWVLGSGLRQSSYPKHTISWDCRHGPQTPCASSEMCNSNPLLETEKYVKNILSFLNVQCSQIKHAKPVDIPRAINLQSQVKWIHINYRKDNETFKLNTWCLLSLQCQ